MFKNGNKRNLMTLFLQIWGFCKMKFCSKIDVNLDSDIPQKSMIAHWKASSVRILPNKSKMLKTRSKSCCGQKYLYNFFCNTLYFTFFQCTINSNIFLRTITFSSLLLTGSFISAMWVLWTFKFFTHFWIRTVIILERFSSRTSVTPFRISSTILKKNKCSVLHLKDCS